MLKDNAPRQSQKGPGSALFLSDLQWLVLQGLGVRGLGFGG